MNRRSQWRTSVALLGLFASACAHTMKVPDGVASVPTLQAEREGGLKERELRLGGAVARQIERSWSRPTGRGLVNFEKAPEKTSLKFAFQHGNQALAGECLEHLSTNMMGLKDPKVSLRCACKAGETVRARLQLEQNQGSAELTGLASYQVSSIHTDERGRARREVLGYLFQGPHGGGAVDRGGEGRAWLPSDLGAEEKPLLLCLYAGLLLYKPSGPR